MSSRLNQSRFQIEPIADGWTKLLNEFESDYISGLHRFPERKIVFLIDFDGIKSRLELIQQRIPQQFIDRVFVLGALTEPEEMKEGRSFEAIGLELAEACADQHEGLWTHRLLAHNAKELERLREHVRPMLFRE